MRALAIDPYMRSVTETENGGELKDMYAAIGCGTVVPIQLSRTETLWLDDNGFLTAGKPVWGLYSYGPVCGKGLVLGTTRGGRTVASRYAIDDIERLVIWSEMESTGQFTPSGSLPKPVEIGGMKFDFAVSMGAPILRPRTVAA